MNEFELANLRQRFRSRYPHLPDPLILATQLGIPPDLRYLRDGLRLSRPCISAFADELAGYLRAVPGARLEVDDLLTTLDTLAAWVDQQDWSTDDPRLRAMARPNGSAAHPLNGYCLGVLHHWSNLFYTLEPSTGAVHPRAVNVQPYEELMREFSSYVVAAQSTIEPESYLIYCRGWWKNGRQPDVSPFDDPRLASRVAGASRAMRRISLVEYRTLFLALADVQAEQPFHARVFDALLRHWREDEQDILEAIARLIEDVRPGWLRPGADGVDRSTGTRVSGKKTVRQKFRDGYVRIADSDVIAELIETDNEQVFEILRPLPPTLETHQRSTDPGTDGDKTLAAGVDTDGQQWMPVSDLVEGDVLESILLPDDEDHGAEQGPTAPRQSERLASHWAQQHLRRFHFAHALWLDRLRLSDVRKLFDRMLAEPGNSTNGRVLTCLHAALATGRSLKAATKLHIINDIPRASPDPDALCYHPELKRWMLPVPPPAWNDRPRQEIVRPVWEWVHLSDATGFHDLLVHFSLTGTGQPVRHLTEARKLTVNDWLRRALPDVLPSLNACRQFLFHRLLAVGHGDLGIARLITSQSHSHGESVAHYAHYDAPVLWRAYQNVWRDDPKLPRAMPLSAAAERQHGYGARRVPTVEAVQTLIDHLRKQIRSGDSLAQHNLYTAYTLCGLVLGLGMRPVSEPRLQDFGEYGMASLFATYLDKARSDYHRRINAVPPVLATHLQRYAHYLRELDRFAPVTPEPLPRFRYLEPESGGMTAFRPSHFEGLVSTRYELELYSLRRFARTYLLSSSSVDSEDVDAFMGHWHERVSPHDHLSTYPMRRLQWLADGAVNQMLKVVGFAPIWMPS